MLHRLAEDGNTVVVIEHNLDVIKTADWIVDLGPEGGDRGGTIIATGTPEAIAAHPASHTGHFLARVLAQDAAQDTAPARAAGKAGRKKTTAAAAPTARAATHKKKATR